MVRRLLFVVLLSLSVARAAVETTTVSGTIFTPSGGSVTAGTVRATLSVAGTTPDGGGTAVVATTTSATINSSGFVSIVLVPNDLITPTGTYYVVDYSVSAPVPFSWREKWSVTTAPDPIQIGSVTRLDSPPGLTAPYTSVLDEGTALTTRTRLNFTGTGVSCSDNSSSSRTDCTITGGGSGGHVLKNEGTPLTARSNLNMIGAGIDCVDNSGADSTDCTASGAPAGSASGDLAGSYPGPTVAADAVALTTDTTGNYVAQLTDGAGVALTNCAAGEGPNCTIASNSIEGGFISASAFTCAAPADNGSISLITGATRQLRFCAQEGGVSTTKIVISDVGTQTISGNKTLSGSTTVSGVATFSASPVVTGASGIKYGNGGADGDQTIAVVDQLTGADPTLSWDDVGAGLASGGFLFTDPIFYTPVSNSNPSSHMLIVPTTGNPGTDTPANFYFGASGADFSPGTQQDEDNVLCWGYNLTNCGGAKYASSRHQWKEQIEATFDSAEGSGVDEVVEHNWDFTTAGGTTWRPFAFLLDMNGGPTSDGLGSYKFKTTKGTAASSDLYVTRLDTAGRDQSSVTIGWDGSAGIDGLLNLYEVSDGALGSGTPVYGVNVDLQGQNTNVATGEYVGALIRTSFNSGTASSSIGSITAIRGVADFSGSAASRSITNTVNAFDMQMQIRGTGTANNWRGVVVNADFSGNSTTVGGTVDWIHLYPPNGSNTISGGTFGIMIEDLASKGTYGGAIAVASQTVADGSEGNLELRGLGYNHGHYQQGTLGAGSVFHLFVDPNGSQVSAPRFTLDNTPTSDTDGAMPILAASKGSVTAAATVTVDRPYNTFTPSGTAAAITTINTCASDVTGKVLIVLCGADATVFNEGGNLDLNAAASNTFTCSTNDTLSLVCDGTNWREFSRSNN